jgi:ATP-dependent Clp endopeptidase proteolytic subunit ClpP
VPAQSWFAFKNSADNKSVEISIYDVIGSYSVSAKSFIAELKRAGEKDVTLRIHSPGGNILEGNAIYNALKRYPGNVDVVIDGIAASMASVVAMAGNTIEIAENGLVMIHNPNGYAGGDSRDLRKMADIMEKMKANIITAYEQKTGLSKEKLGQMMDDETWMTAAEALEHKFVDLIGGKSEAKNSFDLSQFKNCARVVDTLRTQQSPGSNFMTPEQFQARIKELEDAAKNWETVKAGLEKAKADAEAKVAKTEGELKTANEKITKIEGELKTATDKVTEVEGKLKTATDEVAKVKGESKTTDEKAREIAAASGVAPAAKTGEGANGRVQSDGKQIFEAYNKLMTEGKSREASEFWDKHEKELNAYQEELASKRD